MPRSTDTTLLQQLVAEKSRPVYMYQIQITDSGYGVASGANFSAMTKTWYDSEWATLPGRNDAVFTDSAETEFSIVSNTSNELVLDGNPVTGDFTLSRWFYLIENTEAYLGSHTYDLIRFPTADGKYYQPYPVQHGSLTDYEIGKFPQLSLTLPNPDFTISGTNLYRAFENYGGLRNSEVIIMIAFLDENDDFIGDENTVVKQRFTVGASSINYQNITFSLHHLGNLYNKKIPQRFYSKLSCDHAYKGTDCMYMGDLQFCSKSLSGFVISTLSLDHIHYVAPALETFRIRRTESDSSFDYDENSLVGYTISAFDVSADYVWKIVGHQKIGDDHYIDVTSDCKDLRLYQAYQGTDAYTVGIIKASVFDKTACVGHLNTGPTKVTPWTTSHVETRDVPTPGNKTSLVVDGQDFQQNIAEIAGDVDPVSKEIWEARTYTGTFSASKIQGYPYVQLEKGLLGSGDFMQSIQYPDNLEDGAIYVGQQYTFHLDYFGFSTLSGIDANLKITLCAYFGETSKFYYDIAEKRWRILPYKNAIPLNDYNFRTSLTYQSRDGTTVFANRLFDYQKFDSVTVPMLFDTTTFNSSSASTRGIRRLDIRIGGDIGDAFEVVIKRVAFDLYLSTERYGGFPGIPTSGIWQLF